MNAKWLIVASLALTSAAGCGYRVKSTSDYDGRVNFSNYATFFMIKGNSSGDAGTDARLASDVESILLSKGWVEVPEGEGRAAVIVHTATKAEHNDATFYDGWGGWQFRWRDPEAPATFVDNYKLGSVVVTIFDADTKRAIWSGFAADAVSDKPEQAMKVHEAALARMFDRFPASALPDDTSPPSTNEPVIIFSSSPAILIHIDGDPVYRPVPGTNLDRLVNTNALILRDESHAFYLKIRDGWMQAYSLGNWWDVAGAPPDGADAALRWGGSLKDVDLVIHDSGRNSEQASLSDGRAPAVYVTTTPAVLVVTDGAPRFTRVAGSSLERADNTAATLYREPTDQELYLLASGRWYRSWKTDGPWQAVAGDRLPSDLAKLSGDLLALGVAPPW